MSGSGDHMRIHCGWAVQVALLGSVVSGCAASGAPVERAATAAAASVAPGTIDIAFGGDILLGEDMNAYVARKGAAAPLAGVPELAAANLAISNLESVVAPGGDAVDTGHVGDYYFLGRPETLKLVEAAGIDALSTANNHARDFGLRALEQENELLTAMGLAHPGTGPTTTAACAPAYLESQGIRVALFAVNTTEPAYATGDGKIGTCFLAPRDHAAWEAMYRDAFAEAHRKADVVLVMPHFGATFSHSPDPLEREIGRLLIDLGADAVLGNGAHALQGIEVHQGRPIIQDAGSLLFNFPEVDQAALFVLRVSHKGIEGIRTVPLMTEHDWTRPADPTEARAILGAMDRWSADLGTTLSDGTLALAPPARNGSTVVPVVSPSSPGPAPAAVSEAPASCSVTAVPQDAVVTPVGIGPLTLVGARVERDRLQGPALIWLDTFWRVDAAVSQDLSIVPLAVPNRGAQWQGVHEPCDWAWPTSRWKPGMTYRDRYPLRPPPDVQRLLGLPALVSMSGYGRLGVSVGVEDQGRLLGRSGELRSVVLDPSTTARAAILAAALGVLVVVVGIIAWRRRRRLRQRG